MELMACICALQWIRLNSPWPGVSRVQIVTDSMYVKENISRAGNWRKNDWRNQQGEPRENIDLWKKFLSAQQRVGMVVTFEWKLGKKTPILKSIDKAAKDAAKRGGAGVDRGYRPGTVARSLVKGAATQFPARGQTAVIRPYRKKLMGKGEEKVRFDVFSEETRAYTESCYAFASPAIAAELHRQHGYRVRFNDLPKYPQIIEIVEEVDIPNRVSDQGV